MQTGCEIQIILLGESEVGKTSLLLRFVDGIFKDSLPRTTIDRSAKIIKIKDKVIKLTIWDTAGQEMYNSLVKSYYRLADGVLLVYDVRNADTFLKLSKWLINLRSVNEKAEVLIAGNKTEDRRKKSVTVSMVKNFAKTEELEHLEVSAKSGENVDVLFRHLVMKILAAKGIAPYTKDPLLTKLEKSGRYLSPSSILPERSNSPDVPCSSSTVDTSSICISEPVVTSVESYQDSQRNHQTSKNELARRLEDILDASHLHEPSTEDDLPSLNCDSPYSSIEDLCAPEEDTQSTHSAECAMEFFDALGETVLFPQSDDQDIIKLHEGRKNDANSQDDKKCCVI